MVVETQQGYRLLETIGEGAFGLVKAAVRRHGGTEQKYAAKIVKKTPDADLEALQQEVYILGVVNQRLHPNVIQLHAHEDLPDSVILYFDHVDGGELFDLIEPDVGVRADVAQFYFHQLVSGVEFLHAQGVVHRDIKPENLLLDRDGNLKIIDFGFATLFHKAGVHRPMNRICGSPPYMAPEILLGPYAGPPVDVWSVGVVLFTMLTGQLPWDAPHQMCPVFSRVMLQGDIRGTPWPDLDADAKVLLAAVFHLDPTQRATLADVRQSAWFNRKNALLAEPQGQAQAPASQQPSMSSGDIDVPFSSSCPGDNMDLGSSQFTESFGFPLSQPEKRSDFMFEHDVPRFPATATAMLNELAQRMARFLSANPPATIVSRVAAALQTDGVTHKVSSGPHPVVRFSLQDKGGRPVSGMIYLVASPGRPDIQQVVFRKMRGDPLEFKRVFKRLQGALRDIILC